jgi:PDZ domain
VAGWVSQRIAGCGSKTRGPITPRVLVASCMVALSLIGVVTMASAATSNPPKPVLGRYVPATAQVTGESSVHLTAKGPAQVVITYEPASTNSSGSSSRDLIILSWDHFAKRWVSVFDGAKILAPGSSGSLAQNAVLPSNATVFHFSYGPIESGTNERDLEFFSSYNFGANSFGAVGIVHYDGHVANLSYYTTYVPGNGAPRVTGPAGHQELKIPEAWLTDVDPECCAVRNFIDTVGLRSHTSTGGFHSSTYVVTASTQSWLGVFAAFTLPEGGAPQAAPTVLTVVKGSPAAGILQPGDQLIGVAGTPPSPNSDLGPPVIDEIAKALPGSTIALTIERAGAQRVVNITMGSTASRAFTAGSPPTPGYVGANITSMTPSLRSQYGFTPTSGAVVLTVVPGSPADTAGIQQGAVITSFGATPITTSDDLQTALELTPPGTTVRIGYWYGTTQQTATVTMGTFPADDPGPEITSI